MRYEELEKILPALQDSEGVKFKDLAKAGIGFQVVKHIHNGENYRVLALFKYLECIAYLLVVNGEIIEDIILFGILLSTVRENKGLTINDIYEKTGLSPQQIVAIEKGRNYYRSTLIKYIDALDLDFNVKSMLDVI